MLHGGRTPYATPGTTARGHARVQRRSQPDEIQR
jgi:hypothetical protein